MPKDQNKINVAQPNDEIIEDLEPADDTDVVGALVAAFWFPDPLPVEITHLKKATA